MVRDSLERAALLYSPVALSTFSNLSKQLDIV